MSFYNPAYLHLLCISVGTTQSWGLCRKARSWWWTWLPPSIICPTTRQKALYSETAGSPSQSVRWGSERRNIQHVFLFCALLTFFPFCTSVMLKLVLSSSMDAILEATRVYGNLSQSKDVRDFLMQQKGKWLTHATCQHKHQVLKVPHYIFF